MTKALKNRKKADSTRTTPAKAGGLQQMSPDKNVQDAGGSFFKESPLIVSNLLAATTLVADGIAQRRNKANNIIIYHPCTISFLVVLFGLASYQMDLIHNIGTGIISLSIIIASVLVSAVSLSESFIRQAKKFTPDSIFGDGSVTKLGKNKSPESLIEIPENIKANTYIYNGNVVGVASIEFHHEESSANITSWTSLRRYRKLGLGTDLLYWCLDQARKEPGIKKVTISCLNLEKEAESLLAKKDFKQIKSTRVKGPLGFFGITEDTWQFTL
ncbi:hypothetical protein NADFUDRAFT_49698 [Nadsonia fulvescens var. elongata DSM 6958]|uniref:Uncharacterized protein n=1 Tax=Nadsonia fulvescens var. elongata DSM 6958 TaxID=857566 RepID=A0A1E3PPB7_9ASCO|nr:hypothetical protein NADFUDRAFT_49698 [Nadsonia fulvescens var. elongata DSM 6958]